MTVLHFLASFRSHLPQVIVPLKVFSFSSAAWAMTRKPKTKARPKHTLTAVFIANLPIRGFSPAPGLSGESPLEMETTIAARLIQGNHLLGFPARKSFAPRTGRPIDLPLVPFTMSF